MPGPLDSKYRIDKHGRHHPYAFEQNYSGCFDIHGCGLLTMGTSQYYLYSVAEEPAQKLQRSIEGMVLPSLPHLLNTGAPSD